MARENIHFVTGRLAEAALRQILAQIADEAGFEYSVQVLPITVAALMTPSWIGPRLEIPQAASRVLLPGYCVGDLDPIREFTDLPVERGPKDLRLLPEHFGQSADRSDYGKWDIEIIAEINHAPQLSLDEIVKQAKQMTTEGATWINVGCEPQSTWLGITDCIKALKAEGIRVSVDSLNPNEIGPAVEAGAELVLSVNSSNRQHAVDWGCEVVVIPDDIREIDSMEDTIEFLCNHNVPLRLDPILEPIGLGFANSLRRYMDARQRWPEAEMMMGIGNITELTDVDSAGANLLLLAICQDLGVRSVLTTQVINWARSSVKECDIARRLVYFAINQQVPPKHVVDLLVMLRDPKILEFGGPQIQQLAEQITDNNYRILAECDEIHLLGSRQHFHDEDPFKVFDALMETDPTNVDPSHAFYLGFEMCKAMIANQLGKQYTQDEALHWGHLTEREKGLHRLKKEKSSSRKSRK